MTTNRPEYWDDEIEKNQWAAVWSMTEDGPVDAEAVIYVREEPVPAPVKVWRFGERDEELEEEENDGEIPFLFRAITHGQVWSEQGKLDAEAKAMLKKRFGVDVDG